MFVSGGYATLANSISSKPMTETSTGIARPAPRSAIMAVRAEMSLKATKVVKRLLLASSFCAAIQPSSA
jgi:hypothetical protein